jgi:hypothetical protein
MPPLPKPPGKAVHRNKAVVPTHQLPQGGRQGDAPECPYELGEAGKAWWEWAWHTPQATAWNDGALYTVADRAMIEDTKMLCGPNEVGRQMTLAANLDNSLGLTPAAMARLHWVIVAEDGTPVTANTDDDELDMKRRAREALGRGAVAGN